MKYIEKLIDPDRLLILWQAEDPNNNKEASGKRYVVGELCKKSEKMYLQYFDNLDTQEAVRLHHFKGFTTYPYSPGKIYNGNIQEVLSKRVASPDRLDYDDYLRSYRLNPNFANSLSLMQMLAYTGGMLTGDGFIFVPSFGTLSPPYDFTFEIAGFRHNDGMNISPITSLISQDVNLVKEPNNNKDPNAIAVYRKDKKIGYLPRGLAEDFCNNIIDKYIIEAEISKINGTKERPKVYAIVRVT